MLFRDRVDAGRQLGKQLLRYMDRPDVIVLALPRGGVPIGAEVARDLNCPLDIFLVRKLGVPNREELAMGAIASGDVRVLNEEVINALGITAEEIEEVARNEVSELQRREKLYRSDRPMPDLNGRTVILVDDGLATGSTMKAAVQAVRKLGPARVVVAVPVGASDTCDAMDQIADEAVCARTPEPFMGVGMWYQDFSQTTDEEVCELLREFSTHPASA
ncbi:MAG: phosphoribosyltransferase [Gemmataceae bacterium]